ncbi:MAG TPA: hypothetical protein VHZ55_12470 [Bryobacteraceae bacterium]|nr:hypothetical protein [Bryobacteraceae bacterium]
MRLKSYFAPSVQAAVDKARNELGPDAMLISSRQTERELAELGSYEVVFGLEQAADRGDAARIASPAVGFEANSDVVLRELAALREQVEGFRDTVARSSIERATERLSPHLATIFHRLTGAGFSTELSQELVSAVSERTRPHAETSHRMMGGQHDLFARDLLQAVLEEEISSRFEVATQFGEPGEASKAVMFVGAPGAGKTTSLLKIGLNFGLKLRRPLRLLSLDTLRVGAWEQLQRYARISGAECQPLHDFSNLEAALARSSKCLILIDTPGFAKNDSDEVAKLAVIARKLALEIQLVLPAHLSLTVAQQTWERFAPLKPAKLLLTHMDEVANCTAPLEFAIRCGLPVSFLANGQQIPEDLRLATKAELTRGLIGQERAISIAA